MSKQENKTRQFHDRIVGLICDIANQSTELARCEKDIRIGRSSRPDVVIDIGSKTYIIEVKAGDLKSYISPTSIVQLKAYRLDAYYEYTDKEFDIVLVTNYKVTGSFQVIIEDLGIILIEFERTDEIKEKIKDLLLS